MVILIKINYLAIFFTVLLNSINLFAITDNESLVWEIKLKDFDDSYNYSVKKLILAYEKISGSFFTPESYRNIALKIDTKSGPGLSTPKNLINAFIIFLEERGYDKESIILVDFSKNDLEEAGICNNTDNNIMAFNGCKVIALDTNLYYENDWYYESPVPPLLKDKYINNNFFNGIIGYKDELFHRKSFLPIPLLFDVDIWINLAICVDHPITGIGGVLENASLSNVSNSSRFYENDITAAHAIAEILAIPEMKNKLLLSFVSFENFQFIGGPKFNSYYTRSEPLLIMSDDPVALDYINLKKINRERRKNGFEEIMEPSLLLEYSEQIGLGSTRANKILLNNFQN